jgi:hypothetical protein
MIKSLCALVAVPLLALAGTASAGQPIPLSNDQMDHVTAGFFANASAAADALGKMTSTSTQTLANVLVIATAPTEAGGLDLVSSTAVAQSAATALAFLPPIPLPSP